MNKSFEIYTLFSSSRGNCIYVKAGETRVLIDVGKPAGQINKALMKLGTDLSQIDAIFITHAHSDHTAGLRVICDRYSMPVHMTRGTARQLEGKFDPLRVNAHDTRYTAEIEDLNVRSFVIPHDSPDSVGYILDHSGSYRFGMCTDTGCISVEMAEELATCDGVIIEANYDEEMLSNGPYPPYLKRRIAANTGHLSNTKAAHLCCILARSGVKKIMLGHISPENNTPELALKRCCRALSEHGYTDIDITTADRYSLTRF